MTRNKAAPRRPGQKRFLPSPVFSKLQIDQNPISYISTDTSNYQQSSPDRPDQGSSLYEEEHDFVYTYCENHETQASSPNPKGKSEASPTLPQPAVEGRYDARRQAGIVCAPSCFPRDQRRPLRHRTRSCSSEASWLAGNMPEKVTSEEWLSDLHRSETPNHHQDDEEGHHHEIVSPKRVHMHLSS